MSPPIVLRSPFGPNDLLFESMVVSSRLGQLDDMQLGLLSAKPDLKAEDLLGKPVTVSVNLRDEAKRHFHGYVTRFGIGARRGRYFGYHASVRSWLWFLTLTADCRVFHDATVPDIVKEVFSDHPSASFEFRLFRQYRTWIYCVQYRESDYNFVARLLEQEGIYWYWEHGDGQSKLILVDSQSAHDAAPGYDELPHYEDAGAAPPDIECVSHWSCASEVSTDEVVLTSYDFERPSTSLRVDTARPPPYAAPRLDVFDFQGDYATSAHGAQWAEDRLDEHQTQYQIAHASSNAYGIEVGRLLKLARHPREDQNAKYLVTGTSIRASVDAYETGGQPGEYHCDFTVVPSTQQFRPARRTPKPFVQGPQTAVVIGPAGEEIYTDRYGRVKVQFHWDHRGKKDGKDACWVRVSHPWAGKNFGAMHVPRIGQEVVVGFLEGDPDQPLITGRVYNAEQMPPWELPANATQSGILSRSSKGGSAANANAIRFEDKKGAEQLWIHAEKNQDIEVENDETHSVGHDRTKTIGHDETTKVGNNRSETVGENETITIGTNRTERVGSNETITIGASRLEHVGANETIGIGANRSETVGASETIAIGAGRTETVGGAESVTIALTKTETIGIAYALTVGAAMNQAVGAALAQQVGAVKSVSVGAASSEDVGLDKSVNAGKNIAHTAGANIADKAGADISAEAGGKMSLKAGADYSVNSAAKVAIEAASEIVLKCGSAQLILKRNGEISLKGSDLSIEGSGKIVVKASGDVDVTGSNVNLNS